MEHVKEFKNWVIESEAQQRPLKSIDQLNINRKFTKDQFTGDKYETELFPKFRGLQPRFQAMEKMPNLEDFFVLMQNSDNTFYTMVQADELGQPDVRELWRDLTGQRASKMHKYNLAEGRVDTDWKIQLTDDARLTPLFEHFGIAFSELNSKMIYINRAEFEKQGLNKNHILAIEAHEVAHALLEHHGDHIDPAQETAADQLGIRLLEQIGESEAADLLKDRLK